MIRFMVLLMLIVIVSMALGYYAGKDDGSYYVKDFTPRLSYEDFFSKERGMKNPKIFNVAIRHSTLQIGARDENGMQDWDFIPLEVVKSNQRSDR